jgi:carboxypeptidase PM20D1
MVRLFSFVLLVLLAPLLLVCIHTAMLEPAELPAVAMIPVPLDDSGALQRFIGAIRIPTESKTEQPPDQVAMQTFRDYLQQSFPRVHSTLQREVLPDGALLYTWKGRDLTQKPIILMGHMDVVPVSSETLSKWTHGPYSGDVADGFIWGRGTLDDKIHVLSLLEAAETLLARGFTPSRTILFAFGDDEENGGSYGAQKIVQLLQQRDIHPEFVIDEGGFIIRRVIPGLDKPLAVIGTSEKGILNVALATKGIGGHSSEPPPHTAIGQLSAAISRVEDHQLPASMPSVVAEQYSTIAPYLPFSKRLVLGNLWLFKRLVIYTGLKNQAQAGNFHTTTAVDLISGGFKENALPESTHAVINFRILPGETSAMVLDHVRSVVNDLGVTVAELKPATTRNPSPISPTDSSGYRTLSKTIHQVFPEAIVAPNLLNAATDSSFYTVLTPNVYRFLAVEIDPSALSMIHGLNERVAPEKYLKTVQFTTQLLQNIQ